MEHAILQNEVIYWRMKRPLQMEGEIVDSLEYTHFSRIKTWMSRHAMENTGDTGGNAGSNRMRESQEVSGPYIN